jgi:hypothetical protein
VVRATSAKFYLRAGGTKLRKQNEEFCLFRTDYAQLNILITGKGKVWFLQFSHRFQICFCDFIAILKITRQ